MLKVWGSSCKLEKLQKALSKCISTDIIRKSFGQKWQYGFILKKRIPLSEEQTKTYLLILLFTILLFYPWVNQMPRIKNKEGELYCDFADVQYTKSNTKSSNKH